MNVAIIGGGAAGFFLAITLKQLAPQARITIFEKSTKVLSKVAVSGGGRCNLTNSFEEIKDLKQAYPRGDKLLKRLFKTFDHKDTYKWFETHGVKLTTQTDHCVFPHTQDSQTIINCFLQLTQQLGIFIKTSHALKSIVPLKNNTAPPVYELKFNNERIENQLFDLVAITTGGSPQKEGLQYLQELGHQIAEPVPSLFTFNIPNKNVRELTGTVVDPVIASIQGTKFKSTGALLITHWGMSGPAILKLSSYSARYIHEKNYCFNLAINWINETNTQAVAEELNRLMKISPQKKVSNIRPYDLPARLWEFLLQKAGIKEDKKWSELGKKDFNRIMNLLSNDEYAVNGKGAFREEFVTCGGISLDSIHLNTLESKICPNVFFAGEVLDVDAITGGFNFQAAWTTAYIAACSMSEK